jgi:hypothetical protein
MLTDAPPRKSNLAGLRESDRINSLDLPDDAHFPEIAKAIESAMKSEQTAGVRSTCAEFLKTASEFYRVPVCSVRVLASRPLQTREQWTTELFGDYTPETMMIRVWMRTGTSPLNQSGKWTESNSLRQEKTEYAQQFEKHD